MRGPIGSDVLGTAWSHVRWHEPPITTSHHARGRSASSFAFDPGWAAVAGPERQGAREPSDRMAIIVSLSRDRPMRSPCHATLSRPSR